MVTSVNGREAENHIEEPCERGCNDLPHENGYANDIVGHLSRTNAQCCYRDATPRHPLLTEVSLLGAVTPPMK
jgi:hypothetical protein